jgi:hypothetical protein
MYIPMGMSNIKTKIQLSGGEMTGNLYSLKQANMDNRTV